LNAIIQSESLYGNAKEAKKLFDHMIQSNIQYDEATFVILLTSNSHAGWVDEAVELFNDMEVKYGVKPIDKYYTCIIDV